MLCLLVESTLVPRGPRKTGGIDHDGDVDDFETRFVALETVGVRGDVAVGKDVGFVEVPVVVGRVEIVVVVVGLLGLLLEGDDR